MGKKVTIIGAGSVGSTIAYTMAVNGIATEIVMIDINNNKALGEALDIRQATPKRALRTWKRASPSPGWYSNLARSVPSRSIVTGGAFFSSFCAPEAAEISK